MVLISRSIRKVRSAWRLPWRERLWLVMLYPYSGLVRAAVLTVPFRLLSRYFGLHYQNIELSPLVSEQQLMLAWRIGRITELTARYTLWESKCLVQAIMVRTLLGFYGVPYVMHLGARMTGESNEPIKAHAWIKVGQWIVVGREGHKAYAVVSSFVTPSVFNFNE